MNMESGPAIAADEITDDRSSGRDRHGAVARRRRGGAWSAVRPQRAGDVGLGTSCCWS